MSWDAIPSPWWARTRANLAAAGLFPMAVAPPGAARVVAVYERFDLVAVCGPYSPTDAAHLAAAIGGQAEVWALDDGAPAAADPMALSRDPVAHGD